MSIPSAVRWEVHRIACSEYYSSGLMEIQRKWSLDDVLDAHEVLNCFEKQAWLEHKKREKL